MSIQYLGTSFFAVALLHTFSVGLFAKLSHRFPKDSAAASFFHLLSEVEVVFGFWAFLFLIVWSLIDGTTTVIAYQQSLNMTEPLFIFCIMVVASTKPVVNAARNLILFLSSHLSKVVPVKPVLVEFFVLFSIGPLLGSLVTEPAAITIVALIFHRMIESKKIDPNLLYGTIGLLFVNISIGGALTHFAAPPILVVARVWNWGLKDVFLYLGEASVVSVLLNTTLFVCLMQKKILNFVQPMRADGSAMPLWVPGTHLLFLASVVVTSHYIAVFMGLFLVFVGLTTVTKKYQTELKFREALLVGFFLAGLIVFGSFQRWWLEPLIQSLNDRVLYLAAIGLTAVTDNAALTYLGSQVPTITENSKWALVSGALVGGGLTILANAPNPAGFSILSRHFPDSSLNAGKLFLAALPWTLIAAVCFLTFGHF